MPWPVDCRSESGPALLGRGEQEGPEERQKDSVPLETLAAGFFFSFPCPCLGHITSTTSLQVCEGRVAWPVGVGSSSALSHCSTRKLGQRGPWRKSKSLSGIFRPEVGTRVEWLPEGRLRGLQSPDVTALWFPGSSSLDHESRCWGSFFPSAQKGPQRQPSLFSTVCRGSEESVGSQLEISFWAQGPRRWPLPSSRDSPDCSRPCVAQSRQHPA